MLDPTATDTSNYEKVHETWSNFQEYIDSLHKKLSENERFQKFVDNAEDLIKWMDDKEKEICEKYSKMDFEVMMKYRKTVEIEMKSVEQRIKDLKEQFVGMENDNLRNIPDPKNHVIDVEQRFESFQAFVQKWKTDIENSADADKLMKEAENICCWSSEKIEDLKIMATSDTPDCDEIIMWIETNNFDFNSWDNVVVQFLASSQELLNKQNNGNVKQEVERTTELYELAKRTMKTCNEFLEDRIQTINMEKLIFQTHQKAVILASFLQNHEESPEDMNAEDIEKEIRVIDGITVRCTSVVEQIENIEDELRQKPEQLNQLSVYASKQVNDLNEMKEVLKTTVNSRKAILQRLLDVTYFLDNCCETRKHTDTMLSNVKSSRVKLEIVQPIKDQLDSLKVEMVDMMLDDQQKNMANEELRKTYENLKKIEMEVGRQASQKEARKAADRTEAFVGRVQNWIDNNQIQDDTDIVSETVNLRRTTTHYQHLLSICASYKKSIDSKLEELANVYTDNDPRCLLEGIQNSVENFEVKIHQKVDDTKKLLHITENMNELNSQNEWIRAKIKSLSAEPLWDSLLIAQKMRRRHDNDFEEIANRRKQITEVIQKSATTKDQPILLEIEQNWDRMKDLFDERGGVLERIIKLYEYDEESSTTSEWLREKMICADTIEPKEDESFNEVMVKKLEALTEEVENYKPRIVETHALLEDALVTPNTKDSTSQQTMKLKAVLARKQGEIESDYKALKKLVERKLKTLKAILQDADISHQIADIEQWIEVEQNQLNRYLASDSDELPTKLDDVMTNIQRRRSNLTDIKCNVVGQVQMQKIDDAFGMLDVFSFEVHRIRQKACRLEIFKKLESQTEDVIDAIQMKLEEINVSQSTSRKRQVAGDDLSNLAGDLETLRRRVVEALDRSKEVRAANADLAPQVYDTEERLEKQWTDVSKAYENHKNEWSAVKFFPN
nr:C50C3.3 protein - Caenorhabditis elegans [Caenorhabditis elegans]